MKRTGLILIVICLLCVSVFPQKMTEPTLLGKLYAGGEDLTEFFAHDISDRTGFYLEDNHNGKLIVRVCSADEFSTAFVKSPVNPLAASRFNPSVPNEKIFIAQSAKCVEKGISVFNQYWFVPENSVFEYDRIISVNDISHSSFSVDDYDFEKNRKKSRKVQEKQFTENIKEFVNALKSNEKSEGFITHYSNSGSIKRNIERVLAILKKEKVNLQRVKTVKETRLEFDENGNLGKSRDKKAFPELEVLTIKK